MVEVTIDTLDPNYFCVGSTVTFSASTDHSGLDSEITWDIPGGDPNTGQGSSINASFSDPGNYTITAGCGDGSDEIEIYVGEIEITDSDGRSPGETTLEITSGFTSGETITCRFEPCESLTCPVWFITDYSDLTGREVNFSAKSNLVVPGPGFMWNYDDPKIYSISTLESDTYYIHAYPDCSKGFNLNITTLANFVEKAEKALKEAKKIGGDSYSPIVPKLDKPEGCVDLETFWKECEKGHEDLVHLNINGSGSLSAGGSVKAQLTLAMAGVPPILLDAGVYMLVKGKVAAKITLEYDGDELTTSGGCTATGTVSVGGEIGAVGGLIHLDLCATAGLSGFGGLQVTASESHINVGTLVKVDVTGIDIEYTTEYLWGLFEDYSTYHLMDGKNLLNEEVDLFEYSRN